jgi:hypothetical protein
VAAGVPQAARKLTSKQIVKNFPNAFISFLLNDVLKRCIEISRSAIPE